MKRYWYIPHSKKLVHTGINTHLDYLEKSKYAAPFNVPNRYKYIFKKFNLVRIDYDPTTFIANIEALNKKSAEEGLNALSQSEYVKNAMLDWHEPNNYEHKFYDEDDVENIARQKVYEAIAYKEKKYWYNYKTKETIDVESDHWKTLGEIQFVPTTEKVTVDKQKEILGEEGWARVVTQKGVIYIDLFYGSTVRDFIPVIKHFLDIVNIDEAVLAIDDRHDMKNYTLADPDAIFRFIRGGKIKLDELKFSDARKIKQSSKTDYDYVDLVAYLRNKGFEPIGSGIASTAWVNNESNIVVKLTKDDKKQLEFSRWIKQHPNKHYPKIGSILQFENMGMSYFAIFTERLFPIPYGDKRFYASDPAYTQVIRAKGSYDLFCFFPFVYANTNSETSFWKNRVNTFLSDIPELNKQYTQWKENNKSLCHAIDEIRKSFTANDLHTGNVMLRKDGTPVIIDI